MEEEDIDGISVERAHRLGKRNANGDKSRPIIAMFTFHKDKELILSNARFLAGSDFGISQDFPREIVQICKELVKVLKQVKKDGHDAMLVYDKLYIRDMSRIELCYENYENCENSQRYQESLTRCQRDPRRTANFTKITRITKPAKIHKISEGPNENYENYENSKYSQRYQEWLTICQRDPKRTANFTKITRIKKTATQRVYESCENSQRCQEWLTRCQRDPTRTASFT